MEVKNQILLTFHGVEINGVQFTTADVPQKGEQVQVKIDPFVHRPEDKEKFFHIIMDVEISTKDLFTLRLLGVGIFEIVGDLDEKTEKQFINTNGPALMFPYIRSFVSTFTSNVGKTIGTVTIPTQFFSGNLQPWGKQAQ